ncbi:MAG: hypothetical protein AAF125_16345 [Chloroflexota bacterium]
MLHNVPSWACFAAHWVNGGKRLLFVFPPLLVWEGALLLGRRDRRAAGTAGYGGVAAVVRWDDFGW